MGLIFRISLSGYRVARQSFFRFENRALIGVGEAHRGGGVLGEGEMLNKAKCNVLRFGL